jgi:hypothetical protein
MGEPIIKPAPRRSCEECIAIRERVSPPHLRRKLPKPSLPPLPPTEADELRELMKNPLLRPVFVSCARQALESGDPAKVSSELISLRFEIKCRQLNAAALHKAYPAFYPAA